MQDKKSATRDILPENFTTLEEFCGFWDTHSSADYEDAMETVEVEIDQPSSTVYCPVAKDLLGRVRAEARRQGVSSETLINLWLQETLRLGLKPTSQRRISGSTRCLRLRRPAAGGAPPTCAGESENPENYGNYL